MNPKNFPRDRRRKLASSKYWQSSPCGSWIRHARFLSLASRLHGGGRYCPTNHGHCVGRCPQQEVEGRHRNSKDEEHQSPEISFIYQLLTCKLENLYQLGKQPTLQCVSSFGVTLVFNSMGLCQPDKENSHPAPIADTIVNT